MDAAAAPSSATTSAAAPPPKQGFRFHKSGSTSPLPPPPAAAHSEPPPANGATTMPGFRFHKSGATSALPPPPPNNSTQLALRRVPSHPSLVSEPPAGVDPKLFQVVRRITSDTPSLVATSSAGNRASQQSCKNNVKAVTSLVLEKHREYRRKDINWVRSGVEGALFALGRSADGGGKGGEKKRRRAPSVVPVGGGSNSNNNHQNSLSDSDGRPNSPAKKRRSTVETRESFDSSSSEERGVVESSQTFAEPPLALSRSNSTGSTGGMLNASLRNRYKDVQKEREQEQAALDTANASADENMAEDSKTNNESLGGEANKSSTSTPRNPANKAAPNTATPKRKKKTKRTPSKSSSSAAANFRTQDQEDGPYGSSGALLQPSPRPTERYSDLGGISSLLQQMRELIEYPLSHPELFLHLGVEPPRGVLLRGPPGCGKTHLAKAIAGELNVSYFQVSAPELVGGVSGESELRVRTLFESAGNHAPAIIFIDEIDAIAPKRGEGSGGGGGKSMEKRIVAQLLTSMDSIHPQKNRNQSTVMVLGATNRPDAMDPALRRAGRFDREIVLGAPDEKAREGILRVMTRGMRVGDGLDYRALAKRTPGFVGADVRSLTKEAAAAAIRRIFQKELLGGSEAAAEDATRTSEEREETTKADNDARSVAPLTPEQLHPLHVTMDDFLAALPNVQPSSKREGFATVPDVSWGDIGALSQIREELTLSVLEPISRPERFEALGLPLPAGVLLYGPPGCGKTLLAKAIANESGANFISVKGPELLDKYVGESERAVRVVFERARSSSPCIVFFDELDSLCPKRGSDGGGGGVSERVVNQLLTEMDGLDSRRSVFVIAATNRPELIDPAMLRPGRLDKLLYVPLPSPDDRHSILRALSAKVKLGPDVDLGVIARDPHANGFSGADCAALLREAGLAVLRDGVLSRTSGQKQNSSTRDSKDDGGKSEGGDESSLCITAHHFQYAFEHVLPSVSKKDQARYDRLRDRMARARTRGGAGPSKSQGGGDASDVESSIPPPPSEGGARE